MIDPRTYSKSKLEAICSNSRYMFAFETKRSQFALWILIDGVDRCKKFRLKNVHLERCFKVAILFLKIEKTRKKLKENERKVFTIVKFHMHFMHTGLIWNQVSYIMHQRAHLHKVWFGNIMQQTAQTIGLVWKVARSQLIFVLKIWLGLA